MNGLFIAQTLSGWTWHFFRIFEANKGQSFNGFHLTQWGVGHWRHLLRKETIPSQQTLC
jgi:hypothetical protein